MTENKTEETQMVSYHPKKAQYYHPGSRECDYSNVTWKHYERVSAIYVRMLGGKDARNSADAICTKCHKPKNTKGCIMRNPEARRFYYTCCGQSQGNLGCVQRHKCCGQDFGTPGCKTEALTSITSSVQYPSMYPFIFVNN